LTAAILATAARLAAAIVMRHFAYSAQRRGWLASARVICLLAWAGAVGPVSAMEIPLPCCAPAEPQNLTGLSLDELYNMDIVQPNVLGGHTHPAGQMMFGYDYMHTTMEGLYQGAHTITPAQAFAEGFAVVHVKMDMDMQMFDFMQAPTEWLTMMAMIPYTSMSMLHEESNGTHFTQFTSGVGDLELMGLYTFYGDIRKGGNRLVLNLGLSVPTGAIDTHDYKDGNTANPQAPLEYPMRLGSGTWDPMPGLTYLGDSGKWSWGAQTIETIRLGMNYHDYRLGNQYKISLWNSYGVTEWFAPSIRLDGLWWGNVHGADPDLAENPTPEARPYLRSGELLNLLFGLNFYVPKGFLRGMRFTVEGGVPVYQNLIGPQLGTAWMLNAGCTYAF
jgi:hypothetical protein